jgi:hypothetical protein
MRSRLGDDIDDFCVKCKRVMNHLVVSLLNDEPAKVRCRTCHGDHDFRHEQAPPPKIDARKAALIQQALEKASRRGTGAGCRDSRAGRRDSRAGTDPRTRYGDCSTRHITSGWPKERQSEMTTFAI